MEIGLWTTNKVCSEYLAILKYCDTVVVLVRNIVAGLRHLKNDSCFSMQPCSAWHLCALKSVISARP